MRRRGWKVLWWTPRVLGILFALFIGLFALDVFGVGYTFWETVVALLMHLIPVYAILLALALGWRWEWLGGLLFIGLGVLYILIARDFEWAVYAVVAGPAFAIGVLFLIDWRYRTSAHAAA